MKRTTQGGLPLLEYSWQKQETFESAFTDQQLRDRLKNAAYAWNLTNHTIS